MDEQRLALVRTYTKPPEFPAREPKHESLMGWWWIFEVFPKIVRNPVTNRRRPTLGLGRHRFVADGSMLDRSVIDRLKHCEYRPLNLLEAFVGLVKEQAEVADAVAYEAAGEA